MARAVVVLLVSFALFAGLTMARAEAFRSVSAESTEADGIPYAHPSSIRYSPDEDLFYVADTGNHRVVILRDNLEPAGSLSLLPMRLSPFCVLPAGDGSAWISDLNRHDLYKISARGDVVDTLRLGGDATPGRMSWGPDRRIYLIDRSARIILAFDPTRAPVEAETLRVPTAGVLEDLFVSADRGVLITAATGAPFLLLAGASGKWETWGEHDAKKDGYSFPCGVASDGRAGMWVVDAFRHELRRIDSHRRVAERADAMGTGPGQLLFPVGVAIDRNGRPAVLERGGCRVQSYAEGP